MGDGSTTFRLPRILDYMRGGLTADVGKWQSDAIRNITGSVALTLVQTKNSTAGTALQGTNVPGDHVSAGASASTTGKITLDASKQVPTADENRPKTIKVLYCVKAFDAETNPGLVDLTALANEVAGLSADVNNSFAVIYPNSGTAASPATITVNSRYIETNPFPGYNVICQVQCLVNSKWVDIDWTGGYTGGASYGCGARAALYDGNIILQTGSYSSLISNSNLAGNALGNNSLSIVSAPARILVRKGGKLL